MKQTSIVSGFPGIGKSFYAKQNPGVLDLDSSAFSKTKSGCLLGDFPANYIQGIQNSASPIVLVSSHRIVRQALVGAKMFWFSIVYPPKSCKKEYLERYRLRGSPKAFITMMDQNWDSFIQSMVEQGGCIHIPLEPGKYLSDIMPKVSKKERGNL